MINLKFNLLPIGRQATTCLPLTNMYMWYAHQVWVLRVIPLATDTYVATHV